MFVPLLLSAKPCSLMISNKEARGELPLNKLTQCASFMGAIRWGCLTLGLLDVGRGKEESLFSLKDV